MQNRLYLYIKAFSDLGSMMDTIALTAVIYSSTHSSFWLSASLGFRTLGGFLSSLLSGVMADRRNRRHMMIVSDWLRAICIVGLIVNASAPAILAGSFVIGFLGSYFNVSFSAEIPAMFGEGRILETNSLISRLGSISMVLGFLSAGLVQTLFGYRAVLGVDAVSYVLSASFLMTMVGKHAPRETNPSSAGVLRTLAADMSEVNRYLRLKPLFLIIFVGYFVETFGASSHNVGIPLLADELNPARQSLYYGMIWGTWGVGNVLCTAILPRLAVVRRHMYLVYWLTTICMSLGFITFLSNTSLALILSFAFLTGIFDAASGTLFATIMQQTDNAVRGRVFGVSAFLNRLGFGIGFVFVPFLLQRMTMPHMVWLLHGTVITCTLLSIVVASRWIGGLSKNFMQTPVSAES